jgi:hypothetical protein
VVSLSGPQAATKLYYIISDHHRSDAIHHSWIHLERHALVAVVSHLLCRFFETRYHRWGMHLTLATIGALDFHHMTAVCRVSIGFLIGEGGTHRGSMRQCRFCRLPPHLHLMHSSPSTKAPCCSFSMQSLVQLTVQSCRPWWTANCAQCRTNTCLSSGL